MNKREFIDYVHAYTEELSKNGWTKSKVEEAINIFIGAVTKALGERKDIIFIGFGKFYTSEIPEKQGHNPQTGAPITIKARIQPKFSAGEKLKAACNNNNQE